MMTRTIHTLLLASLVLLASTAGFNARAETTVHALLVIMDDDHLAEEDEVGIGPACAVDQYYIENLLNHLELTTKSSVQIKTLLSSEGAATFAQIEQWLNEVSPTPEDVIFIYYSGHGGMNNWEEKRTFLATLGAFTYRDDLINLMKISTVGSRLQMLITDCCSNATEPPPIQVEKASGAVSAQVFENLFLQHTGFLDITGATEGQYSWGSNPDPDSFRYNWKELAYGGTFTHSLITALEEAPDDNNDGFVSWLEVFELTVEKTEYRFSIGRFSDETQKEMDRLRITNQTPKVYSLPKSPEGTAPSLPPVQLKGTVVISGTDDEYGNDEYGKLEHDIDLYIRQRKEDLQIPHLRWGGECRVELSLAAQLVDIGKVEISGKAKFFEGDNEDTTDIEDEAQIFLTVPEEDETDEPKIVATSIDYLEDEEPGTISIAPMTLEPVHDSVTLENTEIGGGDKADIVLRFTVEHIDIDTAVDYYHKQAMALENQSDYTAAIANYTKALRLKPYDPDIRGATADVYHARGKAKSKLEDYEAALADYTKAIRLKSNDVNLYRDRGRANSALERSEAALADYTEAIRIEPNLYRYRDRAQLNTRLKRYEAAIADYTEVIRLTDADDTYTLGGLYGIQAFAKFKLKRYEAAIADYTEVIRLRPDHYFAYMQRGEANENLNRYEQAKIDYQAALRLVKGTGNTGFEKFLEDALERLK